MRLCIDASNLRNGGTVTHLAGLLGHVDAPAYGFEKVIVWGPATTLARISERSWLEKRSAPILEQHFLLRGLWQRNSLGTHAKEDDCDILFVPGGTFATTFRPIVAMSRNLLPFELKELARFGFSRMAMKFLMLRWTQARSFRRADGMIFLTRYAQETVLRCVGLLKGLTKIVPHGIDTQFFIRPRPQRALSHCSADDPFRILYVSTVDVYKHQPRVVEAVVQLRASGYPVVLDLVGQAYPPAMRKLQQTLNRLDPSGGTVTYHGQIAHDELHEIYAVADMGVFASTCENLPNILLEGMAAGLPLACSQYGPMPEVLGNAGQYFDPEKTESIKTAILILMASPELRQTKAQEAWEIAKQYSWDRCADETFRFLVEVAKKGVRRQGHMK